MERTTGSASVGRTIEGGGWCVPTKGPPPLGERGAEVVGEEGNDCETAGEVGAVFKLAPPEEPLGAEFAGAAVCTVPPVPEEAETAANRGSPT